MLDAMSKAPGGSGCHQTKRKLSLRFTTLVIAIASLSMKAVAARGTAVTIAGSETGTSLVPDIQIRTGFKIQVAATEPMVMNPVAMAFDARDRLFVAEQPPYNTPTPQPGRIRLLSDLDEQGAFKTSVIFAEELPGVADIACYDGGVFVAAFRDIYYLKDTDGKGRANERRVVFGGFANVSDYSPPNAGLHTVAWGIDNRFHVGASGLGLASGGSSPGAAASLAGGTDFSFDPRAPNLAAESGASLSGLAFDHRGWKYTSNPDRPLRLSMYREPSMRRSPFTPLPPAFVELVAADTPMYRMSGAKTHVGGLTNAVSLYYMTNARAPFIYRSPFAGTGATVYALVPDPTAGLVHRAELSSPGFVMSASRVAEDTRSEFLSSTDPDFAPTRFASGPDGGMWLADRRNTAGQGRIYRILPYGTVPMAIQSLAESNTYHLLSLLSSPSAWHRETAGRLLYERRDPSAFALLTNVVANSRVPSARIGALWALAGLGAAPEAIVFRGARDTDPVVREHALMLLEQAGGKGVSDEFVRYLGALGRDGSPRVRYQLALTLGTLPRPGRAQTLAEILLRDPGNPWISAAVMNAVDQDAVQLLSLLLLNSQARSNPAILEFQTRMAETIGVSGSETLASQLLQLLASSGLDPLQVYTIAAALGDGLDRARTSLAAIASQEFMSRSYAQALDIAVSTTATPALRAQATLFLGLSATSFTEFGDWLLGLVNTADSMPVLSAAITSLGRYSNPAVSTALLRRMSALPLQARRDAVAALLARGERAGDVLNAFANGVIRASDLLQYQADYLRTHADPAISSRAISLLGPVVAERPALMRKFGASTNISGSPMNGRRIFLQKCASCHRVGQDGVATGMDLSIARGRPRARLLSDIVEPGKQLGPGMKSWVVDTKHGRAYIGLLRDENPSSVILQQPGGSQMVIPKENVLYHRARPWSMMPATLMDDQSPGAMADLLAYLTTPTPAQTSPGRGPKQR